MLKGLGSQRLVALFAGGWLLFNFPLLWAGIIAALAWLMERPQDRFDERPDERAVLAPPPEDQGGPSSTP